MLIRRWGSRGGDLSRSLDAPSQRAILSSLQTGVRLSDEIICSSFPGIPWAGGLDTQRRQSTVAARRGGGAAKGSLRNKLSMYVRRRSQCGGASLLLQDPADIWAWENDRRVLLPFQPLSRVVWIEIFSCRTMCWTWQLARAMDDSGTFNDDWSPFWMRWRLWQSFLMQNLDILKKILLKKNLVQWIQQTIEFFYDYD